MFNAPNWTVHAFMSAIVFPGVACLIYAVCGFWAAIQRHNSLTEAEHPEGDARIARSAQLMLWSASFFAATLFAFRLHSLPLGLVCALTGLFLSFASSIFALLGKGRAKWTLLLGHSCVVLLVAGIIGWVLTGMLRDVRGG